MIFLLENKDYEMLTHTCWPNIINWIIHNKFNYMTELYYLIESFFFFFLAWEQVMRHGIY